MKNNDTDLLYQSATELASQLANKTISAVELLEATISRIETFDKKINAVVVRDFDRARLAAKEADAAIAKGERKLLLGLPVTVKESFNIAGLSTTWGNPYYKNWIPNNDALTITRLKEAGAIIIGKTNVPFMLGDYQSYNDIYGTTNNPWNINFTSGGSSGGSAAALAAGFVSLELGSDLGGSIRIPAHYCGVFGHKPSFNIIPMRGGGPPNSPPSSLLLNDFGVAGPMARTAADLALALKVLAGPDPLWDGKGYELNLPSPKYNELKQFRVLVLKTHPLSPTAVAINHAIDHLVTRLANQGVYISQATEAGPDLAEITRNFVMLFSAIIVGNMPFENYQSLEIAAKKLPPNDMSLEACFLKGGTLSYRDWLSTMRNRDALRQQWRKLYKEFDVVICPVSPTTAFPHDHSDLAKRQMEIDNQLFPVNHQNTWISIATLFGLPATVVPIGHAENGLPIGIQVIGDYLEDYTTIQFAHLIEREIGGFSKPNLSASY